MTGPVAYSIMTHTLRERGRDRVLTQLGRSCEIFTDTQSLGPWAPARMAWQTMSESPAAWCCLLQDDIDLAPGFAEMLESLLRHYGSLIDDRPLSLCNTLKERARNGSHWVERRDGVHGPCIVMRKERVPDMLAWVSKHVRDSLPFDDIRVSLWLESLSLTALWPDPSWVNHRGWEPSIFGTRSSKSQPRTAPSYDGRPLSQTDWSLGLVSDPTLIVGHANGATRRVRTHLWRTNQSVPDHVRDHGIIQHG